MKKEFYIPQKIELQKLLVNDCNKKEIFLLNN